jgi:BirA family transcriptional regulator, biotin operon repressor / biotin---[acetyl-CoA-carboxylase] ligase
MNENSLQAALAGLPIPVMYFLDTVGSTNDFALELAKAGAPDGTLVVADEQTRGRGRLNRQWTTPAGTALAFSLVMHPFPAEMENLGLFAPLCGVAVCQGLRESCGLAALVKWPNDVLIKRRKICGVLVEAHWLGSELQSVIAGIGLNVSLASFAQAGELLFPATCVEEQLGRSVQREALLAAVLGALLAERPHIGSLAFLAKWENWLAFKSEWVQVEGPAGKRNGRVLGVAADGSLRLETETGAEIVVSVGDVRLRPAANTFDS